MGSTGSTWLAKLLNSHPDVLCSHEEVISRVYPAPEYGQSDILRYIEALAAETAHGAYSAIGDVGSTWMWHVACLPSFTTAVLIRHPARLLHTRLRVFPKDQSFSWIPPRTAQILREIWGLDLYAYDPIDRIFLNDIVTFASQVWVMGKVNIILRIEDMHHLNHCQETLHALTGVIFPEPLLLNAIRSRVNQRTASSESIADVVAGFSSRQRDWYGKLLADAGPFFGYSLWDDELTTPPLPSTTPR